MAKGFSPSTCLARHRKALTEYILCAYYWAEPRRQCLFRHCWQYRQNYRNCKF